MGFIVTMELDVCLILQSVMVGETVIDGSDEQDCCRVMMFYF